jgi:hypothetical protein
MLVLSEVCVCIIDSVSSSCPEKKKKKHQGLYDLTFPLAAEVLRKEKRIKMSCGTRVVQSLKSLH